MIKDNSIESPGDIGNLENLCINVKSASRKAALLSFKEKNKILLDLVKNLKANKKKIFAANKNDLDSASKKGIAPAMIQRLKLDDKTFAEMIDSIRTVIGLTDPVGKILEKRTLESGLKLRKISVPLGVIFIIYESRPNVTIDVSVLCIKSGNAVILKGGSEAKETNLALYRCISEVLPNKNMVQMVFDRESANQLLKMNKYISIVIPRGGKELIKAVVSTSTIPVIKHYEGICNIFIDKDADFKKATKIVINAKVQKPSACNAVENLLVHKDIAKSFLPLIKKALDFESVEIRGCDRTRQIIDVAIATEEDFRTEYLANILSVKVVDDVDEAIAFITEFGSAHSDAIITENRKTAERFLCLVDSAAVYHNASTRFTDGGQFGLGCEMGISTDKLHVRGPMGLNELTSYKYVIHGNGQIRK
jgi:glutamate-5-semialdehyde dehydrogenase